jgi:hypothetical protein
MNFFDNILLTELEKPKKIIVGEAGLKPKRGERIYIFRGRAFNVEKELSDKDLDLINKNRNIKLTSVQFGRTNAISKYVTKGSAHIIFFYMGKHKSIKNILKGIPGTIDIEEDKYQKRGILYHIYGRAGSRTWWHSAAVTLSKIT